MKKIYTMSTPKGEIKISASNKYEAKRIAKSNGHRSMSDAWLTAESHNWNRGKCINY